MNKRITVIDDVPSANKKGLRIKVESVELDEDNNLIGLCFEYSGWHNRGSAIVEVEQRNKVNLPNK